MSPATGASVIRRAQDGVRRSALRRQFHAVVSDKSDALSVDLDQPGVDVGAILEEITKGLDSGNLAVQRLAAALRNSGAADTLIERLAAESPSQRIRSARVIGALRLYDAVPWVAELLASSDRGVSDAAARALGKTGGRNSASALVLAIQRRGLSRRLVAELARAAPDMFLEVAMGETQRPAVRPALAMAAGLRRRRTAINPLIALVQHGSQRERAISCRALGWIGAGTAVPVLMGALRDRDWKTRMSAAKALGALRAYSAKDELRHLQSDRHRHVRMAALHALRRLKVR